MKKRSSTPVDVFEKKRFACVAESRRFIAMCLSSGIMRSVPAKNPAASNASFAMNHFRTSTGAEVRFFMPVLNVPFRLIFAHNPQRDGVLDNNLQPAKEFTFRFAVGTTF